MENSFQNSNGSLNNSRHSLSNSRHSLSNSRHSLSNSRSSINHSEHNSQHNASLGSLNNSQSSLNHSHSSLNNSGGNLNNSSSNLSDKDGKKKISVVIKPVSRSAAKRRASTTVKPLSRVPKEIVLTELQTPVSPLRNPKFAVPSTSAAADAPSERKPRRSSSTTTSGTKSSSSKRKSRRGSDSEVPQLDSAKLEKRAAAATATAATAPDSPSVAGSEYSDVSATRQGRSDPPARIQRSSSKDSTFSMLQHVQSTHRSRIRDVDSDDDDDDADDNESLWSECPSTSNFTSCAMADVDDQSTVSDASILLEQAMTPQSYNDLGPRDSPTRRFSVDNGVLADISRQLYNGDERLSNSFLVELDEDEEEDETYNTSFSSMRGGGDGNSSSRSFNNSQKMTSSDSRFTASTSYSSSERNSMSDMQAAFESSLQLSGIDNDDDEQEDGMNLSSYLPGTGPTAAATVTQSDSLSRSCPHLVTPGKAPARVNATVIADGPVVIKRVDSFDGNLPDMHHAPILGSSNSLFPTSALDCSSLSLTAKPKRRPKSALSLDKDASKKKKQGKQKSRSKLEVYE
jgi:hypothetical protein